MRLARTVLAAVGFSLALAAVARPAAAYDSHFTHRWIMRKAVEYLLALHPGRYDAVQPYVEQLVNGVTEEDDLDDGDSDPTTIRVMRHFFRPTDDLGLTVVGRSFPPSLHWGLRPSPENAWDYDDARAAYAADDLPAAYLALGHVIHLIQDATVPAHTHLDAHAPPFGDDYEDHVTSRMVSEFDGDVPLPAPGTPLPVADGLEEILRYTARASFYRNMVPGVLSTPDLALASGTLRDMFPMIAVDWTGRWAIPGVGTLGAEFWEEELGVFYFEVSDVVGAVDRIDFSPAAPEDMRFAAHDGAPMVASMADDLIPVAVLSSAAALKHFMDEVGASVPKPDDGDDGPGGGGGDGDGGADDADDEGSLAGGCTSGGPPGALAALALAALIARRRR